MKERIVYLLGAGFSAPLDLPVVSNFIERSKDLFFTDKARYSQFAAVFKLLREMAFAKTYYDCDLTNVEEVLSILAMGDSLKGNKRKRADLLRSYIKDTIEGCCEPLSKALAEHELLTQNMSARDSLPVNLYFSFVASLLGLTFSQGLMHSTESDITSKFIARSPKAAYAIISMNYDCVLELFTASINHFLGEVTGFAHDPAQVFGDGYPMLAKLHGSADAPESIIPPTWNKTISAPVSAAWRCAHEALANATQIRVLGFSLPDTDAYVRYLLKSAALRCEHLKSFDILCLDDDGRVRERYRNFVKIKNARFAACKIQDYLALVERSQRQIPVDNRNQRYYFGGLEDAHLEYFRINGSSLEAAPDQRRLA